MPSPQCTLNRWGSCSSKPRFESESAKEMDDKFKKMMAERDKIDNLWTTSSSSNISPSNNTKTDK